MAARLYVGNLPPCVTDAQLGEFVSNAGFQVTSSGIVRDKLTGTPWGFGFVDLEEGEDPQRAITWLNGKLLEGNTLNVFAAKPKEPDFARGQGNTRRSG